MNLTGKFILLIALLPEQIKSVPDFGSSFDTRYILGLATVEE